MSDLVKFIIAAVFLLGIVQFWILGKRVGERLPDYPFLAIIFAAICIGTLTAIAWLNLESLGWGPDVLWMGAMLLFAMIAGEWFGGRKYRRKKIPLLH